MALRGHVFSKQLFSSDCFALFIDTFLGSECGVIKGCNLTHSTSSVGIGTGYFCVQGRFLEEESGITFDVSTTADTTYNILVCEIDLSKSNTATSLNQAYYKTLSSTSDWPTLTQSDIGEGIYQFAFCRYTTDSNGLDNFRDLREYLDFDSIYTDVRTQIGNAIEDAEDDFETWFTGFQSTSETSFEEWFETIQDILDEDTAGRLYNLIVGLDNTKADKKKVYNVTLDTTWTGTEAPYTKAVSVNGILATDIVNMYPVYSNTLATRQTEKEEYNKISMLTSTTNSITLICDEEKPETALNVRLEVLY